MSFLFGGGGGGGGHGRENRELREANRRFALHIARDINDERSLAAAGEPPVGAGRRHWLWVGVAALALVVLALLHPGGKDVPIGASCTTPAIALASDTVVAGDPLDYRLTGPDGASYVVTLDGAPVRGDAGSTVSYTQTTAGPALQLQQCVSPTLVIAAPAGNGPHELALLRLASDGTPTRVATTTFTVTGTP